MKNLFLTGIFLFVIISFIGLSLADTISTPQISAFSSILTPTSDFNSSMCQQGQDFIVQVSPTGCTPAVVRSDLLSQQDVPVFCPLVATQTNPLININSIQGISFTGNYSQYVNTIGFYPAQAALNLNGQTQNNYPVLSNIGYVVIDLKQIKNESSMPDFVTGNLTAKLNYNAQNIFGVGDTNFYLPQMSDSDWQTQSGQYGFWNNKGFLRATNIQGNSATIQIYDGNLNPTSTLDLQVGQSSNALSISGFSLCSATMQVKLNSLQNADTMVKLNINGNIVGVVKGQTFLNNQCQVTNIIQQGLAQDAQISCHTDAGQQTFDLRVSPKVTLTINGQKGDYSLGSYLYTENGKSVYLGYVGTIGGPGGFSLGNYPLKQDLSNLAIFLVAIPDSAQLHTPLTNDQLSSMASWVQSGSQQWQPGTSKFIDILSQIGNTIIGAGNSVLRAIISGQDWTIITYGHSPYSSDIGPASDSTNFYNSAPNIVKINGFSQGQDATLNSQILSAYQNATSDYQTVLNTYASETYPSNAQATLGEQALYEQLVLANSLGEKNTLFTLCNTFNSRYPHPSSGEDLSFCNDAYSLSSQSDANKYVSINGQSYLLTINNIYSPTYSDFGAQVSIRYPNGTTAAFSLIKDQPVYINQSSNDYIQLSGLNNGGNIGGNGTATIKSNFNQITLNENAPTPMGSYLLTLTQINLKQFVQVSVTPTISNAGSSTNFSFSIGIEKSAVQLTPDEINAKIAATNATIAQLESIDNTTGNLVNTLSTTCQYTGLALFAKSFINNMGGQGIARQMAMSGAGGWYNKCSALVTQGKYSTQDQCLLQNSDQIDTDVTQLNTYINNQNTQIESAQQPYTTSNSLLGVSSSLFGSNVNTNQFMNQAYIPQVDTALTSLPANTCPTISNPTSLVSTTNYQNNDYTLTDARNLQLYSTILSSSTSSDTLKAVAQQGACSTLTNIQTNSKTQQQIAALSQATGINSAYVIATQKDQVPLSVIQSQIQKFSDVSSKYSLGAGVSIDPNSNVATVTDSSFSKDYLLTYNNAGIVTATYLIGANNQLTLYSPGTTSGQQPNPNTFNIIFKIVSANTYSNQYKNNQGSSFPEVQYFETAPYQGMPAIVPFDLKNGWYAATEQLVPTGGATATASYTAAGQVQSFFLCNVGPNGIEEFSSSGTGDDQCMGINQATTPTGTFAGLDASTTQKLATTAANALAQAARTRANNPSLATITITAPDGTSQNIKVGQPATNSPALKCTDFMSPKDCNILFNVCDPVICPSSRCNFGGAYPVQDVVQSGIIGSVLLCLPNAREGIAIPVCLTGIKAGLDNWISVEKAYTGCLQNNLNTGQTTGICEEMNSIYMCQFFWEQAQPLANILAPQVLGSLAGQGARGGGEYLSVQNAFSTAQQSASYITNYYATNSANAFKLKTTNIGDAFCQAYTSITIPGGADIANALSTTDSPPQYMGTFQEIPFTTATVPPTSQYEVYYHIYAGQNSGVYYSVYLQRTSSTSYYQGTSNTRQIDSGYIASGGYQDQTKDFTATSGYNQLCINVNGNIDCNFQSVTTSVALNAIKAQYLSSEVNNTQISSESDCVSGTPNVYGLLNPNIQNGVTNAINPQIYNQGITRICATSNPGLGTDPNANAQNSRWVSVGTCGNANLKCWLDTQSVANVINSPDIAAYLNNGTTQNLGNSTLQSVENSYNSILQGSGYLSNDQYSGALQTIQGETNPNDRINSIQNIINQVFYNNQKGYLYFLRGEAYKQLALQGGTGSSGTSLLHLDNGGPCIADFDCNSNYCDTSTDPGHCAAATSTAGAGTLSASQNCALLGLTGADLASCIADMNSCTTTTSSASQICSSLGLTGTFLNQCITNMNSCKSVSNTIPTTPSTPAATPTSSASGVTANDLSSAMVSSQVNCQCGSNCQAYANSLSNASKTYNEDPVLLLSIMIQESNCIQSSNGLTTQNGNSFGLMQIDANSVGACSGIGATSDINSNYDKNIQCGALILNQKFSTYANGQAQAFPLSGTCNGFSATYTGRDAAVRGYNGYGCGGDNNYVSEINNIYSALSKIISQNKGSVTSSTTNLPVSQFNTYKSFFDKYSTPITTAYTTTSLSSRDFEALLVAIAQQNNFGASTRGGSDWMMGYQSGNVNYQGADKQVATVSAILKGVLTEDISSSSSYYTCISTQVMSERLSCVLSVLDTGTPNSAGFLGIGANTDGINYAASVLSNWNAWKVSGESYFG